MIIIRLIFLPVISVGALAFGIGLAGAGVSAFAAGGWFLEESGAIGPIEGVVRWAAGAEVLEAESLTHDCEPGESKNGWSWALGGIVLLGTALYGLVLYLVLAIAIIAGVGLLFAVSVTAIWAALTDEKDGLAKTSGAGALAFLPLTAIIFGGPLLLGLLLRLGLALQTGACS